jgi:hypothetical protein
MSNDKFIRIHYNTGEVEMFQLKKGAVSNFKILKNDRISILFDDDDDEKWEQIIPLTSIKFYETNRIRNFPSYI